MAIYNGRPSLKDTHPALCIEWDYSSNELTPDSVTRGTEKKFWWICKNKGCEQKFLSSVYSRTKGSGCPQCSRQIAKEKIGRPKLNKSLADVNPTLAKEWHPHLNRKLSPFDVKEKSGQKVWWLCANSECVNEWQASVAHRSNGRGCPVCRRNSSAEKLSQPKDGQSLFERFPELAKELHPTKNQKVSGFTLSAYSAKKVWWLCPKKECGYEWAAPVQRRSHGSKCPACCGQAVTPKNNLMAKNPALVEEWHPSKNGRLMPAGVTEGSNKKVWWLCRKEGCGHEWKSTAAKRKSGHGCGVCKNKVVTPQNNLLVKNLDLAIEWHPSKNGAMKATDVTDGSNKKVWWLCKNADCRHEWITSVSSRKTGIGCPGCSNKAATAMNNLLVKNPTLFKEWHPFKNGNLKATDVTPGSGKRGWWRCSNVDCLRDWRAIVYNRHRGRGCPRCTTGGYNEQKEGKLYICLVTFEESYGEQKFLKYGITSRELVEDRIIEQSQSSTATYRILTYLRHPDGRFAKELEAAISQKFNTGFGSKSSIAKTLGYKFDGYCETIDPAKLDELLKFIQRWVKLSEFDALTVMRINSPEVFNSLEA